jgi:hypothetical protein
VNDSERVLTYKVAATDEASQVFAKVGAAAEKLSRRQESEGILENLKGSFGRGSTFFEIGHLLEGSGPIRGLSLMSGMVKEVAEHAAELTKQLHDGTIDAGEMVEKLAGGIPVFGQLWSAGRAIREIFTGEAEETERILHTAELTNRNLEAQKQLLEHAEQSHERSLATLKQIRAQMVLIGMGEPHRSFVQAGLTADATRGQADKEFSAAEKQANADANKVLPDQNEALKRARERAERARENDESSGVAPDALEGVAPDVGQADAARKARLAAEADVDRLEHQVRNTERIRDEQIAQARAERDANLRAADTQEDNERAEAQRRANEAEERTRREANERLDELESQARQARLRSMGQDADAELEALKRAAAKEIAAVDEKERQKTLTLEEAEKQRDAIRRRAEDEQDAVEQREKDRVQREADRLRDATLRDFARFKDKQDRDAERAAVREADRLRPHLAPIHEDRRGTGAGDRMVSDVEASAGDAAAGEQRKTNDLLGQLLKELTSGTIGGLLKALIRAMELGGSGQRYQVFGLDGVYDGD